MVKRYFLFILFLVIYTSVYAQTSYNVLDWQSHTTLYKYINHILHAQYVDRDSLLNNALQQNTLSDYQVYCKKRYFKILGSFPEKAPLNARVTGTIQRDGYTIKKVIYESFSNHHVTADLYIPEGEGPFPGVLLFNGHEATAKATTTYQQTAILFAENGFVVLSIDPISQGERYQLTDAGGKPLARGGTTGHTLLASGSNLLGTSVVAYQLWDNERGLDYLCSLKEVDTSRLGCLGNSGGGTQTAYFIPYDHRIKVAAVSSYITRRERTLELLGPQDGCQWLPDESKAGLDISDYLIMFAPKPVLILAGHYDFVDFNGTRDVYRELKEVYYKLNHPDRVKLFAYENGHGIQKPKQEVAVQWFRKWLYKDSAPIIEEPLPTLSPHQLNATQTGQINTDFKNEVNIQDRNLYLAEKWKAGREDFLKQASREEVQNRLRELLRITPNPATIDTQQMGYFRKAGYLFKKLILRKKGQPPLPCYLSYSGNKLPSKWVIILDKAGKQAALQNDSLISSHCKNGDLLLLADLRGIGETADNPADNPKKYYNSEYRNAMLSLFVGRPLPGQRVEDIFTLLDYIKSIPELQQLRIYIKASGPAAEAAILAAALDPRIDKIQLSGTVPSFYSMLRHPVMKEQYSYVIPGALHYFDLPDLVKFIGSDTIQ